MRTKPIMASAILLLCSGMADASDCERLSEHDLDEVLAGGFTSTFLVSSSGYAVANPQYAGAASVTSGDLWVQSQDTSVQASTTSAAAAVSPVNTGPASARTRTNFSVSRWR